MDRKFINQAGLSYETPTLKTLDIMSEGVLCMSSPTSTIDDAYEDNWGTL